METSHRFCVELNEGSFFDEPWLTRSDGEAWRYDAVPPSVVLEFVDYLERKRDVTPEQVCFLITLVKGFARRKKAVGRGKR